MLCEAVRPAGVFCGSVAENARCRAARSVPDHISPCFPLFSCTLEKGEKPKRFSLGSAIGNTHLRGSIRSPLVHYPDSLAPSADEPSDVIGLPPLHRDSLQHYALCKHPFSPLLHTLAGHSYGVDLGRFPRCLSTQLRRRYAALAVSSQFRSGGFARQGSKSHLIRYELRSALQTKSPLVLTLQRPPAHTLSGAESELKGSV